jgi:F-type H+-transporting ATPase subunit alpha
MFAAIDGLFDALPADRVGDIEQAIRKAVTEQAPELCERIAAGEKLSEDDRQRLREIIRPIIEKMAEAEQGPAEDAPPEKDAPAEAGTLDQRQSENPGQG